MDYSEKRLESMLKSLKESDCRITPQRLAILKVLANSQEHPSVEKIHELLNADYPTMSLATVYKTVLLLKDIGEVMELEFSADSNRYDGFRPTPHPHLICMECKTILDPEHFSMDEVIKKMSQETGFLIITHRLNFFGICSECRKLKNG